MGDAHDIEELTTEQEVQDLDQNLRSDLLLHDRESVARTLPWMAMASSALVQIPLGFHQLDVPHWLPLLTCPACSSSSLFESHSPRERCCPHTPRRGCQGTERGACISCSAQDGCCMHSRLTQAGWKRSIYYPRGPGVSSGALLGVVGQEAPESDSWSLLWDLCGVSPVY